MPVFEKPPLETLTPARERWTPIFLEHGRLEVDDSSVKWIGTDRTVFRLPVATLSVIMLGPGTTVTQAAMKACAECNTPVCWVGADGLRFYARGLGSTHDNERARHQANLAVSPSKRDAVARRMFAARFGNEGIEGKTVKELRGMEGVRVKSLYAELGQKYGVTWKGRNYNASQWELSDGINRAVSATNAALYSLTTAVICSLGYLPELGFIHINSMRAFVLDIADLYKTECTLPAAFEAVALNPDASEDEAISRLKFYLEERRILSRMPIEIADLLKLPL